MTENILSTNREKPTGEEPSHRKKTFANRPPVKNEYSENVTQTKLSNLKWLNELFLKRRNVNGLKM